MSYILEAIKKAEHERGSKRLSNHAVEETRQEETRRSQIPWVAIAIFINALILMAWIVYQILSDQPLSSEQPNNTLINKNDQVVQVDPVIEQSTKPEEVPKASYEISTPAIKEQDAFVLEEVTDNGIYVEEVVNVEDESEQRMISVDDMIDEELPVFLSVKQKRAHMEAESMDKEVESETLAKAKIEPLPKPQIVRQEPNLVVDKSAEIEQQLEVSAINVPQIRNNNVPDFEELPYSLQQQIPSIAISVHIYNSQVDARKVRVNGQLLYEGEQVDNETLVEEITPHGVIFDYAGTLFRKTLN